jgi:hypothetical protein
MSVSRGVAYIDFDKNGYFTPVYLQDLERVAPRVWKIKDS